ncbi:hypothetical protein AB5J72_13225 [Streptomyces sp. CG1]|uniref:hypothetical protein n=1 Tax=Streptomyces sp. CG1 TaxID=1287523 RepID=UPI0034E2FBB8
MATPPPTEHTTPARAPRTGLGEQRHTGPDDSRHSAPGNPPHRAPGGPPLTTPHTRNARVPGVPLALRVLRVLVGLLLALGLLGLAHHARPAPYGDRLVRPARVEGQAHSGVREAWAQGGAVVGHGARSGVPRWRYARVGHRPVTVVAVRGEGIALWDDGLLTDTDGRSVRWHRALPDAAEWLPAQGGTGVLRPLGHGMLAVVTPSRVTAYRIADGDLRWVLPAGTGCGFRPEAAVRLGAALLIARPCAQGAWTGQLIALDDLGRITPARTPLGNDHPRHGPNART